VEAVRTVMEEELSREMEGTGIELKMLEVNRNLEEGIRTLEVKQQAKAKVKMVDQEGAKIMDKIKLQVQDQVKVKTNPRHQVASPLVANHLVASPQVANHLVASPLVANHLVASPLVANPQASVLGVSCRPALMFVQGSQPGCSVLVLQAVLKGVRLRNK